MYLGRSLIARAGERDIDAVEDIDAQPLALFQRDLAEVGRVGFRHVREANAKTLVIRSDQWIAALKIDVVLDHHQRSLRVLQIDSARRVRQTHGPGPEPSKDTNRKRNPLHGVAFIEM